MLSEKYSKLAILLQYLVKHYFSSLY